MSNIQVVNFIDPIFNIKFYHSFGTCGLLLCLVKLYGGFDVALHCSVLLKSLHVRHQRFVMFVVLIYGYYTLFLFHCLYRNMVLEHKTNNHRITSVVSEK